MLILTWLLYILAEAKAQAYLIDKRKWKPIYIQLFIIRGIAAVLHGALVMDAEPEPTTIAILLFYTTSFWILFDITLNFFRNKPFDYRGKTSGWLDRMPYSVWFFGKIIAIATAGFSFMYIIRNA